MGWLFSGCFIAAFRNQVQGKMQLLIWESRWSCSLKPEFYPGNPGFLAGITGFLKLFTNPWSKVGVQD